MSYSKRDSRKPGTRITDAAVAAYREARELQDGYIACLRSDEMCEHETCERYLELSRIVHRELGLKPWDISPLDAEGECTYPRGTGGAESWPMACELRAELEQAMTEESNND